MSCIQQFPFFIKFLIYCFKGNLPTDMSLVNRWDISRANTFILTPPLKPVKLHQKTIWTNTSEQSSCLINIHKKNWYSLSPHVPILSSVCVLHHASLYQSVSRTGVLILSNTFWWQILCSINAQKFLLWNSYVVCLCVYSNPDGPKPQRHKNQKLMYMQHCWHKTKEKEESGKWGQCIPSTHMSIPYCYCKPRALN